MQFRSILRWGKFNNLIWFYGYQKIPTIGGIVKIVFNLTFITYLVDFCKPNVYNTKCKIT
uniref:Uncharacterized protein n=1 Tax=Siphoviridae sp. ctqSm5 TaxID=2827949 RepID=A0A8S5SNX0_9CAUD|nr:MAG TPA: hypothetical protein [Siphoviridae sp. ctqSm5]